MFVAAVVFSRTMRYEHRNVTVLFTYVLCSDTGASKSHICH